MYIISDMEVTWNVSGEEMLSLLILINQNIWGFSTENIDVSLGFQKLWLAFFISFVHSYN